MRSRFSSIAAVLRLGAVGALAVAGTLVLSGGPAMAAAPGTYTCSGGDFATGNFTTIPSGIYSNIWVKGACQPERGAVITVLGGVTVAPHAVLDAQTYPSTITVGQDVTVGTGSLLGLGCLPDPLNPVTQQPSTLGHPCTDPKTGMPSEEAGSSNITIDGNVNASKADTVLLNGITVKGNVTLTGSKGTANTNQRSQPTAIPWAIKLNTIGGDLTVSDATPIWLGVLLNNVAGNVTLTNIQITDGLPPNNDSGPTIIVALNTIGQNLGCSGLGPNLWTGVPFEVNNFPSGGEATGQCAT